MYTAAFLINYDGKQQYPSRFGDCSLRILGRLRRRLIRRGIPPFFRDQMTFAKFAIMKFFLGSVGSSMLFQGLMSGIAPEKYAASRALTKSIIPYRRTVPGCFVLGIGMYLAGTGPTLFGVQLAMGIPSAPYILLGALAGGVFFGLLEPHLGLDDIKCQSPSSLASLDEKFHVRYETIAIPAGIALLGVAFQLEHHYPHSAEAKEIGILQTLTPIYATLIVGMNQIPIRLITTKGQGGSTSVMNFISTVTGGRISPKLAIKTIPNAYQFLFVYVGMASGAWLCCNRFSFVPSDGYSLLASVIGGFLTIFGARCAAGCTCGHGVSGVSEFAPSSIAAAVAIFAGGIATGMVHSFLEQD